MMNSVREEIKRFVRDQTHPTVPSLALVDGSDYPRIVYLAEKLCNIPLSVHQIDSKVEFSSRSGACLFWVDVVSNTIGGDLSLRMQNFLSAIRVMEVYADEWSLLPPTMRNENIAYAASQAGIAVDELKKLQDLWGA